jgi:hypothetical protein
MEKEWTGADWEQHVQTLLHLKYTAGEYQEVPDGHGGDHGIEGFSRSGEAYQCYAPEGPHDVKTRCDKQKRKIGKDINKFIKNRKELTQIFNTTIIKKWILVVPKHDSAEVITFATNKANEVRRANLPYAAPDFDVVIETDNLFELEKRKLGYAPSTTIDFEEQNVSKTQIKTWQRKNAKQFSILVRKMKFIPVKDQKRLIQYFVEDYIKGSALLEQFKEGYPELYHDILRLKQDNEKRMEVDTMLKVDKPNITLMQEINQLREALRIKFPGIGDLNRQTLTNETIADWLLRCPLSFD